MRTAKKYGRRDGSVVRFDDNACVLINKAGDPMGTRLNGMEMTACDYDGRLFLTNSQGLLLRNYEENNGQRFSHWHQHIYRYSKTLSLQLRSFNNQLEYFNPVIVCKLSM